MKRLYVFHLAEAKCYKKMVQIHRKLFLCNGYHRALCSRKYRNPNFISWDFCHEFCITHLKNCIDFIKNGEKSNRNWKEIIFQGFPRYSKIAYLATWPPIAWFDHLFYKAEMYDVIYSKRVFSVSEILYLIPNHFSYRTTSRSNLQGATLLLLQEIQYHDQLFIRNTSLDTRNR